MNKVYSSRREAIIASYHFEVLDGIECSVEATEGGWVVVVG